MVFLLRSPEAGCGWVFRGQWWDGGGGGGLFIVEEGTKTEQTMTGRLMKGLSFKPTASAGDCLFNVDRSWDHI